MVDVIPLTVVLISPFRAVSGGTGDTWNVNPKGGQRNVIDARESGSVLGSYLLPRGVIVVRVPLSFRWLGQRVP
jgi:hypothetical protein